MVCGRDRPVLVCLGPSSGSSVRVRVIFLGTVAKSCRKLRKVVRTEHLRKDTCSEPHPMVLAGSSIDVDIPDLLEMGRVGRIRVRMEGLGGKLGLPEGIPIREPGLDPGVVDHIRVRNHGLLRSGTCVAIHVLRGENVLLGLRVSEWHGGALGRDGRVNFEALLLVRRGVRLH
jgi:hypothetical protein